MFCSVVLVSFCCFISGWISKPYVCSLYIAYKEYRTYRPNGYGLLKIINTEVGFKNGRPQKIKENAEFSKCAMRCGKKPHHVIK